MKRLAVLLLLAVACKKKADPAAEAQPTPAPMPTMVNVTPPANPADVTFVVASDTHFGFPGTEETNARLLDHVRKLPGIAGLVVTGDLTEWGKREEWDRFLFFYGDGKAPVPVFEMMGNHDKVVDGPFLESQIASRHGNGRFYSWDWGSVHLVSLGEAPDDDGIAFLERDLAAHPGPTFVFFHLCLSGPYSTDNWFAEGDHKAKLAKTLRGHHISAIVHGHHHRHGRYVWEGFDVFKPGAAKHNDHSFVIISAKDQTLTAKWLDYEHDAIIDTFTKKL